MKHWVTIMRQAYIYWHGKMFIRLNEKFKLQIQTHTYKMNTFFPIYLLVNLHNISGRLHAMDFSLGGRYRMN